LLLQICLNFCSISSRKEVTAFSILAVFLVFASTLFAPIVECDKFGKIYNPQALSLVSFLLQINLFFMCYFRSKV
jgi:hypothetical protein